MITQALKQFPAIVLLLATLIGSTVGAAQITVNSLDDPGAPEACALRDAITAANTDAPVNGCPAGSGDDTITFTAGLNGTLTLTATLPDISSVISIDGGNAVTVSGGGQVRVMIVDSGATLNLSRVSIANGTSQDGGGILNNGTLTVTASTFSRNTACCNGRGGGGGIVNFGILTVTNCTFSDNTAVADTGGGGGGIINARFC